jgi:hypothetical protein
MGAGSAGPLVRRGDSAVQEHAYGVEKASLPVGPAPSFPSVGLRSPFIDATRFLSQAETNVRDH